MTDKAPPKPGMPPIMGLQDESFADEVRAYIFSQLGAAIEALSSDTEAAMTAPDAALPALSAIAGTFPPELMRRIGARLQQSIPSAVEAAAAAARAEKPDDGPAPKGRRPAARP